MPRAVSERDFWLQTCQAQDGLLRWHALLQMSAMNAWPAVNAEHSGFRANMFSGSPFCVSLPGFVYRRIPRHEYVNESFFTLANPCGSPPRRPRYRNYIAVTTAKCFHANRG